MPLTSGHSGHGSADSSSASSIQELARLSVQALPEESTATTATYIRRFGTNGVEISSP